MFFSQDYLRRVDNFFLSIRFACFILLGSHLLLLIITTIVKERSIWRAEDNFPKSFPCPHRQGCRGRGLKLRLSGLGEGAFPCKAISQAVLNNFFLSIWYYHWERKTGIDVSGCVHDNIYVEIRGQRSGLSLLHWIIYDVYLETVEDSKHPSSP